MKGKDHGLVIFLATTNYVLVEKMSHKSLVLGTNPNHWIMLPPLSPLVRFDACLCGQVDLHRKGLQTAVQHFSSVIPAAPWERQQKLLGPIPDVVPALFHQPLCFSVIHGELDMAASSTLHSQHYHFPLPELVKLKQQISSA